MPEKLSVPYSSFAVRTFISRTAKPPASAAIYRDGLLGRLLNFLRSAAAATVRSKTNSDQKPSPDGDRPIIKQRHLIRIDLKPEKFEPTVTYVHRCSTRSDGYDGPGIITLQDIV